MFCSVNGDNLGQTHIQTPEFIDDETESICCYVLKAHRATFLAVQWLRSAFNAGDMGSIPGPGTKIPHAVGQLSPHATTREKPSCCNYIANMLWNTHALKPMPCNKRSHCREASAP